jgi:hypothetical protein
MFRQEHDGCLGRNLQPPLPADKYRKEDEYATVESGFINIRVIVLIV